MADPVQGLWQTSGRYTPMFKWRCFAFVVVSTALCSASAIAQDKDAALFAADIGGGVADAATTLTSSSAAQQNVPPPVEHTGLDTLVKDILADFKAFPRRESTWVILGLGGAAALAVHPADGSVNSRLVSSGSADKLWKPGHIIGGPMMYGVPVALYFGGR